MQVNGSLHFSLSQKAYAGARRKTMQFNEAYRDRRPPTAFLISPFIFPGRALTCASHATMFIAWRE